jgi:pSer/pThr/pTyr-binding forkhead associated (FHA) protein
MLNAKLVVVGGGDARVSEIQLKLPTTIGRSREAKIKLPHPLVSRKHCEIFERDGKLFVRDLGSLNGTYVNSQKIDSDHWLQPDQLLTLGTVTFRAIYQVTSAGENGHADGLVDPVGLPAIADVDASPEPATKPAPVPAVQAELDTERDSAASDTDTNLPNPATIDLAGLNLSGERAPEVASSIFIEEADASGNGSVSLSEIAKLPGGPAALSFAGGLQLDNNTTQPAPVANALPKIDTRDEKGGSDKPPRRRPR